MTKPSWSLSFPACGKCDNAESNEPNKQQTNKDSGEQRFRLLAGAYHGMVCIGVPPPCEGAQQAATKSAITRTAEGAKGQKPEDRDRMTPRAQLALGVCFRAPSAFSLERNDASQHTQAQAHEWQAARVEDGRERTDRRHRF